jgi:hypothetical protein
MINSQMLNKKKIIHIFFYIKVNEEQQGFFKTII